ncbi:hypothetical protein E2562_022428 [Oryza meyeriana var. granulata]|uniref:Uncharacterized protein n=1 Tax=Oryza meyeriana var. granulata TaxID=110450 RepID=A0A6G1BN33_9ORYZ|nr:hypothetical protein E2562_022428 [Oryza meyeriana var. granulata]
MSTYIHQHAYFSQYSCTVFRGSGATNATYRCYRGGPRHRWRGDASLRHATHYRGRHHRCCRGATEDHPPTEEDPATTTEGDTTTPAEVSASAFLDIDEAAGLPTPLIGATEDRTPVEDLASTT